VCSSDLTVLRADVFRPDVEGQFPVIIERTQLWKGEGGDNQCHRTGNDLAPRGYVYIAQPPLYQVRTGKEVYYAYNDKELNKIKDKVGNKSVTLQQYKGLGEMDPDQLWDTTMNINLRGIMLCTRAVFSYMMNQQSGYIINISSGAGKHGGSMYATYSTSKFGVIGFTECLASEGRRYGIKASVICPGPVATKMRAGNHPNDDISKLMQPEDIADVALFLVTQPKRAYIGEVSVSTFLF
jgi:NAD(P)-dependent dehydrogenase (short-subunit alcohol dehydrogenase family)